MSTDPASPPPQNEIKGPEMFAGPAAVEDCRKKPAFVFVVAGGKPTVGSTTQVASPQTINMLVQSDTAGKFAIGKNGWNIPVKAGETVGVCFKAKPGAWPAFWNSTPAFTIAVS